MATRKHSKIDALPQDLKETVEFMMQSDYTYKDIVQYIKENGHDISISSVYRHAKSLDVSLKQIKMVQENFRAINEELQKYPDIDTTDSIIRLLSHQVLERVQNMGKEELEMADPLKLMKEISNLIRTATYKKGTDIKNMDIMQAGYEKVKSIVFEAMQKEDPQLYKKVSEFLNAKVDLIKDKE